MRKPSGNQLYPHKDNLVIENAQTCNRFYGSAQTSDNFCAQLGQPNENNCEILSSPIFLANMELTTAYGDPIALYYLVAVDSMVKPSHCSWPILYSYVSSYKNWVEREVLK